MIDRQPIKGVFDKQAEVDFQRRFKTPEVQNAARDVQARAGKLVDQAKSYRDERLKKIMKDTQEKPKPILKPSFVGGLFGQQTTAQRDGIRNEHSRFQRRSDRILKARDNELQRIDERQLQRGTPEVEKTTPPRDKKEDQRGDNNDKPQDRDAALNAGQEHQTDHESQTENEAGEATEADPGHEPPEHGNDTHDGADFGPSTVDGAQPVTSWTEAERYAAISAEREAREASESDLGYDYDPGRII